MWIVLLLEEHTMVELTQSDGQERDKGLTLDSEALIKRIRADAKTCQDMITDSAFCLAPIYKVSLLMHKTEAASI